MPQPPVVVARRSQSKRTAFIKRRLSVFCEKNLRSMIERVSISKKPRSWLFCFGDSNQGDSNQAGQVAPKIRAARAPVTLGLPAATPC